MGAGRWYRAIAARCSSRFPPRPRIASPRDARAAAAVATPRRRRPRSIAPRPARRDRARATRRPRGRIRQAGSRLDALGRLGFGYVVGGTFTRRPREGNPVPRIVAVPAKRPRWRTRWGCPTPARRPPPRTLAIDARDRSAVREHRRRGRRRRASKRTALLEPHVDARRAERELPERLVGSRPRQRGAPARRWSRRSARVEPRRCS